MAWDLNGWERGHDVTEGGIFAMTPEAKLKLEVKKNYINALKAVVRPMIIEGFDESLIRNSPAVLKLSNDFDNYVFTDEDWQGVLKDLGDEMTAIHAITS